MLQTPNERARERARATAGVVVLHALLGWGLIVGFDVEVALPLGDKLKLFDVAEPPPPEPSTAEPPAAEAREGAAAPPSLKAEPAPIVAPPARLPVPSPVVAAPEPTPLPPGTDPAAGQSTVPGRGTGTGGEGAGTGSGGQGSGTGGGGSPAQRLGGRLSGEADYPASARRAGIEGSVSVRYIVGTDGRVSGCRVTRSSANGELDATTCRLIEQRFRYRPARDAQGRPIPEPVTRTFDWLLPFRR